MPDSGVKSQRDADWVNRGWLGARNLSGPDLSVWAVSHIDTESGSNTQGRFCDTQILWHHSI